MTGCIAHARNGRISTSGLIYVVTSWTLTQVSLKTRKFRWFAYGIFAWIFRTFWPKLGVLGAKWGKGWCDIDPQRTRFFLGGVLTSVPILVKIDQEIRLWECPQTDTLTDTIHTNRFYNLSHAICSSYGTDTNIHWVYLVSRAVKWLTKNSLYGRFVMRARRFLIEMND